MIGPFPNSSSAVNNIQGCLRESNSGSLTVEDIPTGLLIAQDSHHLELPVASHAGSVRVIPHPPPSLIPQHAPANQNISIPTAQSVAAGGGDPIQGQPEGPMAELSTERTRVFPQNTPEGSAGGNTARPTVPASRSAFVPFEKYFCANNTGSLVVPSIGLLNKNLTAIVPGTEKFSAVKALFPGTEARISEPSQTAQADSVPMLVEEDLPIITAVLAPADDSTGQVYTPPQPLLSSAPSDASCKFSFWPASNAMSVGTQYGADVCMEVDGIDTGNYPVSDTAIVAAALLELDPGNSFAGESSVVEESFSSKPFGSPIDVKFGFNDDRIGSDTATAVEQPVLGATSMEMEEEQSVFGAAHILLAIGSTIGGKVDFLPS